MAGVQDPNGEATDFIEWVSKRTNIIMLNRKMALRAGELKKRLRIAMPGCYVIAAAEIIKATPLFKVVEKEMEPVLNELRKLGVKFLREIKFQNFPLLLSFQFLLGCYIEKVVGTVRCA